LTTEIFQNLILTQGNHYEHQLSSCGYKILANTMLDKRASNVSFTDSVFKALVISELNFTGFEEVCMQIPYQCFNLGQMTQPLYASVSSPVK